MMLTCWYL